MKQNEKKEYPAELLAEVETYLGSYLMENRMLEVELRRQRAATYAVEAGQYQRERREDAALYCRARMYEIKEFVRSLPDGEEKVFLFSRYLCGDSPDRIAEDMNISLRSVYRLRRRALNMAAGRYCQQKKCPGA